MGLIINLLITAGSAYVLQKILSGVSFTSFGSALIFALVLGIMNTFLKPILQFFSLPFTILTLGLFSLVVNATVVLAAEYFVDGVKIDGWGWAIIFSLLLSIMVSVISAFTGD